MWSGMQVSVQNQDTPSSYLASAGIPASCMCCGTNEQSCIEEETLLEEVVLAYLQIICSRRALKRLIYHALQGRPCWKRWW